MVVLLIVLMFAVFIAADYMFNREKYRLSVTLQVEEKGIVKGGAKDPIMANLAPVSLHPAHTWAVAETPDLVRVGLDAFAARLLPVPDKVETPKLARWVSQGARGFTLHCGAREVMLLSPVDGEVVEVNREALENPGLLKSDPYGRGWLMKVRSQDMPVSMRNLLDGELAHHWMEDSMDRLRQFFASFEASTGTPELAVAQDGGPMVDSLAGGLDDDAWKKMTAEFFRS